MQFSILKRYQRKGVQLMLHRFNGRALLTDDMGLGKSVQAMMVADKLGVKTLIACPASLKWNWVDEYAKFDPKKRLYICEGQTPPHAKMNEVDVFIINYEILSYWKKYFIALGIELFIADEGHWLKNRHAKRTKAAFSLSEHCKHVLLLTGTPIENRPEELWSQIYIINRSFFPSWLLFVKRYNGATRGIYGWEMLNATNVKELHQFLINNCMIRRMKEDVLPDLPARTTQVIPLEIDNRKEYQKAEDDIISWIHDNAQHMNIEKAKKVEAQIKIDKLKLIAAQGKLKQFVEWVNETSRNKKLVVFCYHRKILHALHNMLDNHVFVPSEVQGLERQKLVRRFQSDETTRVFLSTIRVGGTGFNLTASDQTVFLQCDWTASKHDQASDRVRRIGQESDKVFATYFIARGTIEEKIIRLLDKKNKESTAIIDGQVVENDQLLTELLKEYKEAK